jgi:zinc transport system permease protein
MQSLLLVSFAFLGPIEWIDSVVDAITHAVPEGSFFNYGYQVRGLLAIILVSLICGAVGSLVVGGRMAFFSDALAHCAFAGVTLGYLLFLALPTGARPQGQFWTWVTPVMVTFGLFVGFGISVLREWTKLASDTVIGIFFAAAIGMAASLRKLMQERRLFNLEDFLFGELLFVSSQDLVILFLLLVLTTVLLAWIYNQLLLTGVNSSLALSRRVPTRWVNLAFVLLLAVVVNLCLRYVGALLINALLVVPAATAMNVSRNLRQLFWTTVVLCLVVSLGGLFVSWEVEAHTRVKLDAPGTVIMLAVLLFIGSAVIATRRRRPQPVIPSTPEGCRGSSYTFLRSVRKNL